MNTKTAYESWIASERDFVLRHRGLVHPFFERLESYCAEPGFLKGALRQLYHLVLGFPFHIAGAVATCRDEAILRALVHNLYAEVGAEDGTPHITIYRRLLEAVSASTAPPGYQELWPETVDLGSYCEHNYRSPDMGIKLGSLYAFECMSSPMVARWSQSLRRATQLTEHEIEFFVIHIDIEIDHVDDVARCCQPYYDQPAFRSAFRAGSAQVMRGLERLWDRMKLFGDELTS